MVIRPSYSFLGKSLFLLWVILFTIPQLVTIIIVQQYGVLFAFTGFYWMVNIGFLLGTFALIWKYDHPLTQILGLVYCIFTGYVSFRFLQPEINYFNPVQFYFNIFMAGLLSVNIMRFLVGIFYQIATLTFIKRWKITKINRKTGISLIISILWLAMTAWSYIGFNQTYLIEDAHQDEFRVSFWGLPSMGDNFSKYNTPEADIEMGLYQSLNSSFIYNLYLPLMDIPTYKSNITAMLHEFEEWDLEFFIDCRPLVTIYDESSGEWITTDDYPSYWYAESFNKSLDIFTDWIQTEGFTNFRGLALDIEGMMYSNSSKPMSFEEYARGIISYSERFAEFRADFPGKIIYGISMEGIMWDPIDGDYDLDISQRTLSNELNLDFYSYMTYHTGSDSPGFSDYRYLSYLQHGFQQHGQKFQPWVGWWNDLNSIENPIVYEQTIRQFKIAKSLGGSEVVLAPSSNFIGANLTEGMGRLQDLVDIIEDGFTDFEIPITNNMRLIKDPGYWLKKIHPTYWIVNESVFMDLQLGTPFNWLLWVQLCITCLFIMIFSFLSRKKQIMELLEQKIHLR
jgi:hypothetical protein